MVFLQTHLINTFHHQQQLAVERHPLLHRQQLEFHQFLPRIQLQYFLKKSQDKKLYFLQSKILEPGLGYIKKNTQFLFVQKKNINLHIPRTTVVQVAGALETEQAAKNRCR